MTEKKLHNNKIDNSMFSNFMENARLGKNTWWSYLLTHLSIILTIVVTNVSVGYFINDIQSLFPDNDFGMDLMTYIIMFVYFSIYLIVFAVSTKKLHQRPLLSFITNKKYFDWLAYFKGFLIYSSLFLISIAITDFDIIREFINNLNLLEFTVLFIVGFLSIGVLSFFEEILCRGYWLQGLHLKIKRLPILVVINALILDCFT